MISFVAEYIALSSRYDFTLSHLIPIYLFINSDKHQHSMREMWNDFHMVKIIVKTYERDAGLHLIVPSNFIVH